jgi:site-specific DNA-methyltransferase (adenine-specific)
MIHNENCLNTMAQMPNESIDLVITSPPYDNLRTYKGFDFNFKEISEELFRILKPGGVIVWIVNDAVINGSKTGSSFKQALQFVALGLNLHDVMIWQKPNYAPLFPSIKRYDQAHEYMFIISKQMPKTFNPIKDKTKSAASINRLKYGITHIKKDGSRTAPKIIKNNNLMSKRTTVWNIPNGQERGLGHPAVFPEQLAIDHILTWSNKEDLIYDPFIGSGTTAIAAIKTNRQWIGSEISQEYTDIANNRIALIKEETK